jgi:chemotaxis receptor (MCP) glutamine deamidase CheD
MTTNKFQVFDRFPDYLDYKFVNWDELRTGKDSELLGTDSVAPCLAITLYDPEIRVGALAHITGWNHSPKELKPERIIDTLLCRLESVGDIDYQRLEATLAGEGTIFVERQRNSSIVRNVLMEYEIPIIGEDLCKAPGRLVFLHCDSGLVEVYRA